MRYCQNCRKDEKNKRYCVSCLRFYCAHCFEEIIIKCESCEISGGICNYCKCKRCIDNECRYPYCNCRKCQINNIK